VKRLLILSLFALLLVPAVAGATLPKPDTYVAIRHENGPAAASVVPAATQQPVIRTIASGDGGSGDNTVAIALASAALGIALGGTAYMTFRLRPQHRSS
jgi:Mrp family chromosome partitioning ATPase